jgi:hypothetical protein
MALNETTVAEHAKRLRGWDANHERMLCTRPKCAHEWDSFKQRPTMRCDWCGSLGAPLSSGDSAK